jgi:hypothetical protein
MADYPYPNSFLEPVPGFPVNATCAAIAQEMQKVIIPL